MAVPDILFVALSEFNVEGSKRNEKSVLQSAGFAKLYKSFDTKIFIVEGTAYFSRAGPSPVDSLELWLIPCIHRYFNCPTIFLRRFRSNRKRTCLCQRSK